MSDQIVRVAFVGGGRTGGPLLEALSALPYVRIVGVADSDVESPGAVYAREHDIFFTEFASVLGAMAEEIDLIVEVSGDPSVKPALKEAFRAQGNTSIIIVHDLVARLLMTLASGSDTLAPSLHPDDRGIGQPNASRTPHDHQGAPCPTH
jgi:predicted dinucleotide-utilizing enzyme